MTFTVFLDGWADPDRPYERAVVRPAISVRNIPILRLNASVSGVFGRL
jgi:hypothetical protein